MSAPARPMGRPCRPRRRTSSLRNAPPARTGSLHSPRSTQGLGLIRILREVVADYLLAVAILSIKEAGHAWPGEALVSRRRRLALVAVGRRFRSPPSPCPRASPRPGRARSAGRDPTGSRYRASSGSSDFPSIAPGLCARTSRIVGARSMFAVSCSVASAGRPVHGSDERHADGRLVEQGLAIGTRCWP